MMAYTNTRNRMASAEDAKREEERASDNALRGLGKGKI